jgi:hypothetical protein
MKSIEFYNKYRLKPINLYDVADKNEYGLTRTDRATGKTEYYEVVIVNIHKGIITFVYNYDFDDERELIIGSEHTLTIDNETLHPLKSKSKSRPRTKRAKSRSKRAKSIPQSVGGRSRGTKKRTVY